jgi:hypothetical protein
MTRSSTRQTERKSALTHRVARCCSGARGAVSQVRRTCQMTQILLTPRIPSTVWETRASEIENLHYMHIYSKGLADSMSEFIRYLETRNWEKGAEQIITGRVQT